MRASRLGPSPAIWLGSSWMALASSSSVSSHAAVGQHVLHRPGHHVRRRLRRAGEFGVVALIGMDDAAESRLSFDRTRSCPT